MVTQTNNIWQWRSAPQRITLETLFQSKDKFSFLVGSGISLDPPSCLPTGHQFTRAVLQRLIPEEEQKSVLNLMNPEREGMEDPGDFLRFEQLMEYLQRYYDPELQALDCFAICKNPNPNHQFLAHMIKQGHIVLTTNFDSLIEYAILESGVSKDQIYPIIHRQDWESQTEAKKYPVYKLHGSLFDIHNNQDCRESIQATLAQIAQEKGETFQLEPWKQQILHQTVQNYDLIVLGYSGLDDFDVLPTLWSIPSHKRILWITHANNTPEEAKIEVIEAGNSTSPTSEKITLGDRVSQNLLMFVQYKTRQPTQIIRIMVHTAQFLEWLGKKCLNQPITMIHSSCPENELVLPDHLSLQEDEQWLLTGKIFDDRNRLSQSLHAYQTALKYAEKTGNKEIQGLCLNNIGLIFKNQGRLEDALDYYQQALQIAEEISDLREKATRLNNIGRLLSDRGMPKDALDYYQQALEIDDQLGDLRGKAIRLSNIGSLLYSQGLVEDALDCYQQTLHIAEQLGDLKIKATQLNNIGQLLDDQGLVEDALNYYNQALRINEQIGDFKGKASQLNNIGTLLDEQGYSEDALDYYQQALKIDEQIGDLSGKATRLSNLGLLFKNQGHLEDALEYYKQALEIDEQIGNLQGKATRLNNIGLLLKNQGHLEDALEHYKQALEIDEQIGNLQGKTTDLNNIGTLLHNQGLVDDALDYFKQALEIDERLGNFQGKVSRLYNIGSLLYGKGLTDEALDYYQQALKIAEELNIPELLRAIEEAIDQIKA